MKYLDLLLALDWLCRYHPKYYSNEVFLLAEDVIKWMNNELPEDSSTLAYLRSCYSSPQEALYVLWKEVVLLAGSLTGIRWN